MITWADKNSASVTEADRIVSDDDMNNIKSSVNALYGARVGSASGASSLTPNLNTGEYFKMLAMDEAITVNAPTGTPYDGQPITFKFIGVAAWGISWNSIYEGESLTLPAISIANKVLRVHFMYDADKTKWVGVGLNQQL